METDCSGEVALWLAVIQQAILDATRNTLWHSCEDLARDASHRWLMLHSRDFLEVCAMAGLDPDYVRTVYQRALHQGRKNARKGLPASLFLVFEKEKKK